MTVSDIVFFDRTLKGMKNKINIIEIFLFSRTCKYIIR